MNSKHRRTLLAIFADPVRSNIEWRQVEALFIALECRIVEGSGSRVRFDKGGETETFHRPHPAKEAKRYQVRAARSYLLRLGIKP